MAFFFIGYRHKGRYKIKKDEPVLVFSNHQTDIDSVLVNLSFSRLLHTVATDNLFKKGFMTWLLDKFGTIPKRKGAIDLNSTMQMIKTVKNKQSVLIFPEGNRAYAEFQYFVSSSISRLAKATKATLVIFNLHGGNGTRPRFGKKPRHGKFYGEIKKVMKYEEYKDLPDEELCKIIVDNLRVYDSESGLLYKSKSRAEYLERMMFVCPSCRKSQTLYSKRQFITCNNCGFQAEFTEDLHLKTSDPSINYTRLLDWYNYQIDWVKQFEPNDKDDIFVDQNVKLVTAETRKKSQLIAKGKIVLNKTHLTIGELSFDLANIEVASPVSGTKLLFTHSDKAYEVQGHERFNPLKYVFMFNKLDTHMHKTGVDNYFPLEAVGK